jgi:2-keto-4-pentenoate hydratase/2-oxohepta-3-ene-1,7-dioic acid hydratase in catechol pathway
MRLASFNSDQDERFGVLIDDDHILDLTTALAQSTNQLHVRTMLDYLRAGEPATEAVGKLLSSTDDRTRSFVVPLSAVQLLAPIPRPPKMVFVGRNYNDHIAETAAARPAYPSSFSKLPSNVIGPDATILLPAMSSKVDFEAELAIVIGRPASRVAIGDAYKYIAGYTIANDVCARDVQLEQNQLTLAKNFRTFAPMGPVIRTADDVPDPKNLGIRLWLNGELMQDGSTAEMVFAIDEILSFLSSAIDFEPGDVISTGTPAGVGYARTPPIFLKDGDDIRIEIDGLGCLQNSVSADPLAAAQS